MDPAEMALLRIGWMDERKETMDGCVDLTHTALGFSWSLTFWV